MKSMEVHSFGPIRRAHIDFGDLTVLVGPQASGKSLFVQLYKAVKDAGAIRKDLKSYGFDWLHGKNSTQDYCSIYFGGGLEGIVEKATVVKRNGKPVQFSSIVNPAGRALQDESVFLIPAQRVMVLQDGWPRPFMGYSAGDSYCLRRFSETVRLLMEQGLARDEQVFPQPKRLISDLKVVVDQAIYVGAKLKLVVQGTRKRIVLAMDEAGPSLPFNTWSAGQREFTPLLLGLYWLMPPGKARRRPEVDSVIVEEPETGLHPQAIVGFGLLMLELLQRGYRVILSVHTPVVLDLVWAIRELKEVSESRAASALRHIFGFGRISPPVQKIFDSALNKEYRTYFFERREGGVVVRDISSLDPGDEDAGVSGWGGLSGFSGRIAEIVGSAISEERA
jgi:hypothetical protein